MVDGDNDATTALSCQLDCEKNESCYFWDFGGAFCRLRADDGGGPGSESGYIAGVKNCIWNEDNTGIFISILYSYILVSLANFGLDKKIEQYQSHIPRYVKWLTAICGCDLKLYSQPQEFFIFSNFCRIA